MSLGRKICIGLGLVLSVWLGAAQETIPLWPGKAPGEVNELPEEVDTTKPDSDKVAGSRVMRIGNVSIPTLTVHHPPENIATGTSVVICPGGGHYILAWDLEGTEVAEWLNSIGVTAVILKYRVPAREKEPRWRAAVQDAQRAVGVVRSRAKEWNLNPERIGILGFSAGGETAILASLFNERTYERVDDHDDVSHLPSFSIPIYAAGVTNREGTSVHDYIVVDQNTPPMFFVHTFDDFVRVENCLKLYLKLKQAGIPSELHAFDAGGHGYGLRPQLALPVTGWPKLCAAWMNRHGWLSPRD